MWHYFWPLEHTNLLSQLTRREIHQRFKGSWLGLGWSLLTPLAMLAVYTLVFTTVLKARWPGTGDSPAEFALHLFSGLIVFNWFSEVMGRGPGLVREQTNLVKKVVFPLELLSWVSIASAGFHACLSLLVLAVGVWWMRGAIDLNVLALPLVVLLGLPMLLGFSWLLAALGVFIPDTQHLVAMLIAPLLFLSPVFYPVSALPELFQTAILFNPLTILIESVRACMLGGDWPAPVQLVSYGATGSLLALLAAMLFHKARRGFADAL